MPRPRTREIVVRAGACVLRERERQTVEVVVDQMNQPSEIARRDMERLPVLQSARDASYRSRTPIELRAVCESACEQREVEPTRDEPIADRARDLLQGRVKRGSTPRDRAQKRSS